MQSNKLLACALVASSIFIISLPAFADTSTQPTAPLTGQIQNSSPGTANTPADRAAARKQKLQNEILHLQNAEQFQQNLTPIRQLQAQDKQLRNQVITLRQTIHAQVKTDRQSKNYTALLAALNDMIPMQDDLSSAQEAAQSAKTDWAQLRADNQANNTSAVTADLSKIQTDIQTRINVYQKILADLQKINGDLNTPSSTATPSATSATSAPTT
jgi:exonuclease VII large subunit